MVLFAPCVDDNTLAIIHINLVLHLVLYLHMHTGMCNCKLSRMESHHMHDQCMGMNTIQQPFLSCFPAFYALVIPMSCYISNVLVCVVFFLVCFGQTFFLFHE